MTESRVNLASFSSGTFDRQAGRGREALWLTLRATFFLRSSMPWYGLRRTILRAFGARIGRGVIVKPQAKITFPWKLQVGDFSWIGEECWILNLERVVIGRHACISQRAMLCTGNHDWSDPAFALRNAPIAVGDGAWVCAGAFVGPGVTLGDHCVVTAGSVVTADMPPGMICGGNPCRPLKPRNMAVASRGGPL